MIPRGIRNNNPGNIRLSNDPWQGLAPEQLDSTFFTFRSPEFGIRAMCRIIISYRDKYDLNTVREIINRWAPTVENDTEAYVQAVAGQIGVGPDDTIDVHEYSVMRALIPAIITHENGQQPYSAAIIDKGLGIAGIENPVKPGAKSSPVVISSAVGGASVSGSGLLEAANQVQQLQQTLSPYTDVISWMKYGLLVLAVVSFVLSIIYRVREQPRMI